MWDLYVHIYIYTYIYIYICRLSAQFIKVKSQEIILEAPEDFGLDLIDSHELVVSGLGYI